jgi:hypothetical protein
VRYGDEEYVIEVTKPMTSKAAAVLLSALAFVRSKPTETAMTSGITG